MYFTLTRLSDFYLISVEIPAEFGVLTLYLIPGKTWNWSSDPQDARRFQYATEALNYAAQHCPVRIYRYLLEDGYIQLNLATEEVQIQRTSGGRLCMKLETLRMLKDFTIPTPKKDA